MGSTSSAVGRRSPKKLIGRKPKCPRMIPVESHIARRASLLDLVFRIEPAFLNGRLDSTYILLHVLPI